MIDVALFDKDRPASSAQGLGKQSGLAVFVGKRRKDKVGRLPGQILGERVKQGGFVCAIVEKWRHAEGIPVAQCMDPPRLADERKDRAMLAIPGDGYQGKQIAMID